MELSSQILDEERRARRRVERESDLGPGALSQVEAGFPILYDLDGELVKEYPDGSRYVVRLVDLGRSDVHVREI